MQCRKAMASAVAVFCLGALMIGPSFASEGSAGVLLKATPEQFDAGKVAEGKTVEVTASIQNIGSAPVEITNVRTSWACTEAMLGKHTLNPNEKTDLKVVYATAGRPGPFEKTVTVTTNIPGHEKIEIFMMKGEVLEAPGAKIAVVPRRVVLAGSERDTGKKQTFSITNEGSLPLVISSIRSKDGKSVYFNGEKEGNLTIEPGQTKPLELQLPGNSGEKEAREFILILSNARNAGESGLFIMVQYGAP